MSPEGTGAASGPRTRVAIVTNIPTPYRQPVYAALSQEPDIDLALFFFSGREPDRQWDLVASAYCEHFLRERFASVGGRFIHFNPDIWKRLKQFKPDVVVTTGYNPTHLLAIAYASLHRLPHVAMTDGTFESERKLTYVHRAIRRWVLRRTRAFVGASEGAFELFRAFGVDRRLMFKSHLCGNNAAFLAQPPAEKRYDLLFCGRVTGVKNPVFVIDVAKGLAERLGRRVSVAYVGSGDLLEATREAAHAARPTVDTDFLGFAKQAELPARYAASRLMLFPSSWDPWGVVANEALASGVPVLVSPVAGVAHELVRHGHNGYVLPLDVDVWVDAAARLIGDTALYRRFSAAGKESVGDYTFQNAARGLSEAIRAARQPGRTNQSLPRALRPRADRHVAIVQRRMTHYRLPMFDLLRELLASHGVELTLAYGQATAWEAARNDGGDLSWGRQIPCSYWLRGRLCWQNLMPLMPGHDLLVVTHENKLLFNYLLPLLAKKRWALWGHGKNFQASSERGLAARLKAYSTRLPDWWFAYTNVSAEVVRASGFPESRITVLNNSIDTSALRRQLDSVDDSAVAARRAALGVAVGPVASVIASLIPEKRLDFVIDAAQRIRAEVPGFQLLIAGDGPLAGMVRDAADASGGWIHALGPQLGRDKALVLRMSDMLLNPGMVGLGILDSFVAGVPMATTDCGIHSPEIAYLRAGDNGLITPDRVEDYAAAVVALLNAPGQLAHLKAGCLATADSVSLEAMCERFTQGVLACLEANRRSGGQP